MIAEARVAWVRAVLAERTAEIADEALTLAGQLRPPPRRARPSGRARPSRPALPGSRMHCRRAGPRRRDGKPPGPARPWFRLYPPAADGEIDDALDLPAVGDAVAERSDVAAAEARVAAGTAEVRQARAASFPRIGVGAFWQRDGGETDVQPYLSLELPIWDRNRSAARPPPGSRGGGGGARADPGRRRRGAAVRRRARPAGRLELQRLGTPFDDARESLKAISVAFDCGELDVATAVLLRGEVLAGWCRRRRRRRTAAELTIAASLATEHPSLLEVTP